MPGHIDWIHLLHGCEPPAQGERFTWVEIGCGYGVTALAVAALHPQARVYAVDRIAAHIRFAREFAERAGLDNIVFDNTDVRVLARCADNVPACDYLVANDVYSRVTEDVRDAIECIATERLRPGGCVAVSYDALPGAAGRETLRVLLRSRIDEMAGGMEQRIAGAVDSLIQAVDDDADLAANLDDGTKAALTELQTAEGKANPRYAAHEYCTPHSRAFYHREIAQRLAGLGLAFIGQASAVNAYSALTATQRSLALAALYGGRSARESAADTVLRPARRLDLFARGSRPVSGPWVAKRLRTLHVTSWVSREGLGNDVQVPSGGGRIDPALREQLSDALLDGGCDLGSLAEAAEIAGYDAAAAYRCVAIWSYMNRLVVWNPVRGMPPSERVQRFNDVVGQVAERGDAVGVLLIPDSAAVWPVGHIEALALHLIDHGVSSDERPLAKAVMDRLGYSADNDTARAVRHRVSAVCGVHAPHARRLGVIAPGQRIDVAAAWD